MRCKWFLVATICLYTPAAWAGEALSPYSGQETREIKAVSKDEITGYLSGDGMGFAKAAELNHYPRSQACPGVGGSVAAFRGTASKNAGSL